MSSPEFQSSNFEIRGVEGVVDRSAIEARAHDLIDLVRINPVETYKDTQSYQADARTLLFEALKASGHLSCVEISGNDLIDINNQVLTVLLNGWSDSLPEIEQERRFMELCEELTIQEVHRQILAGILPEDTLVSTISDYPDGLSDIAANSIGYRLQNRKGMVRTISLRKNADGTLTRVSEQVSRSNAFAGFTEDFLQQNDVHIQSANNLAGAILGTQLLSTEHEMQEGVVGLARRLDEAKGLSVRYGEVAHKNQVPYELLRSESLRREDVAECFINKFAKFTKRLDLQLHNKQLSQAEYTSQFKAEARSVLRAICTMDPGYAADCFGEAAEAGFTRASYLLSQGDLYGSHNAIMANIHLEIPPNACGLTLGDDPRSDDSASLLNNLRFGKENWKWTRGQCRVQECDTRPGETEVGPCSVCRECQAYFDKGQDPKRMHREKAWRAKANVRAKRRRNETSIRKQLSEQKERTHPSVVKLSKTAGRYMLARETIAV